jgi:hypothetical protein
VIDVLRSIVEGFELRRARHIRPSLVRVAREEKATLAEERGVVLPQRGQDNVVHRGMQRGSPAPGR